VPTLVGDHTNYILIQEFGYQSLKRCFLQYSEVDKLYKFVKAKVSMKKYDDKSTLIVDIFLADVFCRYNIEDNFIYNSSLIGKSRYCLPCNYWDKMKEIIDNDPLITRYNKLNKFNELFSQYRSVKWYKKHTNFDSIILADNEFRHIHMQYGCFHTHLVEFSYVTYGDYTLTTYDCIAIDDVYKFLRRIRNKAIHKTYLDTLTPLSKFYKMCSDIGKRAINLHIDMLIKKKAIKCNIEIIFESINDMGIKYENEILDDSIFERIEANYVIVI